MTVTAQVTQPGSYTYRWYVDGALVEENTTGNLTFGDLLLPGRHWLSVIAASGDVLGSTWEAFDVIP